MAGHLLLAEYKLVAKLATCNELVRTATMSHNDSELQIIGAGFGRTGTLSLKVALETLGFDPCYHMVEVFENAKKGHPQTWARAARGKNRLSE